MKRNKLAPIKEECVNSDSVSISVIKQQKMNQKKDYLSVPPTAIPATQRPHFATDTSFTHQQGYPTQPATVSPRELGQPFSLPLTELQVKQVLEESRKSSMSKKSIFGSCFQPLSSLWDHKLKPNKLNLKNISNECVFHYELESLVETRVVSKVTEPWDGEAIDGIENGAIPQPWDAPVTTPSNFEESEITFLMPHSESITQCRDCEGEGCTYCPICRGLGRRRFSVINPGQSPSPESKKSMMLGEPPCYKCKMTGQVKCKTCDGVGHLKTSQVLTVSWKKLHDHVYSGKAAASVPVKKLKKVKGVVIKSEWGARVSPLPGPLPSDQYSVPEVAQASIDLQLKHATAIKNSRIVEQRQTVEQIPITVVNYDRRSSFFVYGTEKQVFFPKKSNLVSKVMEPLKKANRQSFSDCSIA